MLLHGYTLGPCFLSRLLCYFIIDKNPSEAVDKVVGDIYSGIPYIDRFRGSIKFVETKI